MLRPELSVVVVAHQVVPYVGACLDSLARQTVASRVEVVAVVGERHDDTGRIVASAVGEHPGWQLVRSDPAAGPGGARNVGVSRASGTWLAFLDGDDLLPHRAYERLLGSAARSGSDLVTGGVRRWDGRWLSTSQLHRVALDRPLCRGHITRDTRLVYDSCVWNKVVLRSTWDAAGIVFPEGVVYEDLPVAFAMHVAARSTDVVTDPVYLWRLRTGLVPSITQRLDERASLEQRMAALDAIDALAVRTGAAGLRDAHDAKVVDIDLRRMVTFLPLADDAYRVRFLELARNFLAHVPDRVLTGRDPVRRLVVDAVRRGDVGTLVDLAVARNVEDRPPGLDRVRLLAPDLRVQQRMRRRGMLTGLPWLSSTTRRVAFHLLPEPLGRRLRDRRYARTRVADGCDVLSI